MLARDTPGRYRFPAMLHDEFILFSGTAYAKLAAEAAQLLDRPLGLCAVERFPDGEVNPR